MARSNVRENIYRYKAIKFKRTTSITCKIFFPLFFRSHFSCSFILFSSIFFLLLSISIFIFCDITDLFRFDVSDKLTLIHLSEVNIFDIFYFFPRLAIILLDRMDGSNPICYSLQNPVVETFEKHFNRCCLFWCCSTEPLLMTARIPVSGYTPGQNINVELELTNNSDENVSAFVLQLIRVKKK